MTPPKKLVTVQKHPAFQGMSAEQLRTLAGALAVEQHPLGHVFGHAGRQGRREKDAVYFLLEGEINVYTQPKGADQVPVERQLQPGEFFGAITFLRGGSRTATTTASTPVRVAALTRESFSKDIEPIPALRGALMFALASQLARDVRACNDRLARAVQKTSTKS